MASAKRGDVPGLTGLRAVAAYAVLFAHAIDFASAGCFHAYR
jgi:peptidoglycan/LPS O-acetylase OafA/YrhL